MNKEQDRLWKELTHLHNGIFEIDDEIKTACPNEKEIADKITAVYNAIEDLQQAIKDYGKKTA